MSKAAAQRLRPIHSPSSTPRQHQIKLRAASRLGQPRPISRKVLASPVIPSFAFDVGERLPGALVGDFALVILEPPAEAGAPL